MTLRQHWISVIVVAAMMLAGSGCQSCSHSMDYCPPVADCQCGTCGCGTTCGVGQRAGSAGCHGSYGGYDGYEESVVEGPAVQAPAHCEGCNR